MFFLSMRPGTPFFFAYHAMPSTTDKTHPVDPLESINIELLCNVLDEVAVQLDLPQESAAIQRAVVEGLAANHDGGLNRSLEQAASVIGIRIVPIGLSFEEFLQLLMDGYLVIAITQPTASQAWVMSAEFGSRIRATQLSRESRESDSLSNRQLRAWWASENKELFMAEPSLSCHSISSQPTRLSDQSNRVGDHSHQHDQHQGLSPFTRWMRLIRLDARDIVALVIFGIVVSVLDLATPLAVEQMVTTIGFANLIQPLIWIAIMLFSLLTLSALLKGLQLYVVEILQQRVFVRIVGDFAERFPRIARFSMRGYHGPELANRFFDVMTIQKSTAALLTEFLSLAIHTVTGLVLLAIYSPFLLAFDIVLILCMTLLLFVLGRGGVRSAVDESLIKYRLAHWLQDIIGNPIAFQTLGGGRLALDRANRLTVQYLAARKRHFRVLIRQSLFALLLYAISMSALLSLGGWLVLNNSLTIGQLVASVSVVAVVVGAFSKIGKSLESFYDLLSAIDKIGHLLDLETLPPARAIECLSGPAEVRFKNVRFENLECKPLHDLVIEAGKRVAIVGEGPCGKSILAQAICGLTIPDQGMIEVGQVDARESYRCASGSFVGLASDQELFHGSIQENVSLHRASVQPADVRGALQLVELWDDVLSNHDGLETQLQTGGYPLSHSQRVRLLIARAVVSYPRLVVIDSLLDQLPSTMRIRIWKQLSERNHHWTLIVITDANEIQSTCDLKINLATGEVKS